VIAYMPTPREITVDMARLKGAAAGAWFDPVNGSYIAIPGGPIANSGLKRFVPPRKVHDDDGDGDWVLLLDASGRSF
jgi:Putative collagen-binding domain of a collagenase